MFTGIFIPEGLARSSIIGPGPKLAWGRLARYAGENGRFYPTVKTLAAEIGVRERQAQNYLGELETAKLIRRVSRFNGRAQESNAYEFLWHEVFSEGVQDRGGGGVQDPSPRGVQDRAPKESQDKESPSKESKRLGRRLSGHELQKTQFEPGQNAPVCKQYPTLREALADYMHEPSDGERIYPTDRHAVDVMDAAEGATETDVLACLRYLYDERGLKPGTRNGPRSFSWFPAVVADYFRQKRERQTAASARSPDQRLPQGVFDAMTEAIGGNDVSI
jgi:hypothetical protein